MNKKLIAPVLTIVVGVTWLLNALEIIPVVDWVWTIGLAAAGIICLAAAGLNKLTVVTGPFLIIAAVCSYFRQTGNLSVEHEIPVLVIVLGILMLIAQLSKLPLPDLLEKDN